MAAAAFSDDFYTRIKPWLRRRVGRELRLARRVLDVGCGSCELVHYLARTYGQQATGVDVSAAGFAAVKGRRGKGSFRCLRSDAAELGFARDASVDAVVTVWSLHEIAHPAAMLAEARRVLRPGGEALIVDFPRDSLAQRLWDESYFSLDEVVELLEDAGFTEVSGRLLQKGQLIWARGFCPPHA